MVSRPDLGENTFQVWVLGSWPSWAKEKPRWVSKESADVSKCDWMY